MNMEKSKKINRKKEFQGVNKFVLRGRLPWSGSCSGLSGGGGWCSVRVRRDGMEEVGE